MNICILLVMNARRIKCVNEGGTRETEKEKFPPNMFKVVITHKFRGFDGNMIFLFCNSYFSKALELAEFQI